MFFNSAVFVVGPPRGGTTIVGRCLGKHSKVQSINEPFHRRRKWDYQETSPLKLCEDFKLTPKSGDSLLVKETFTRPANVSLTLDLAKRCREIGLGVTLVQICRSPLAGFDSQTRASREMWRAKNNFEYNEACLRRYLGSFLRHSLLMLRQSKRYPHFLVLYEAFCDQPERDLGPIMASMGLVFESDQLALKRQRRVAGGDPSAWASTTLKSVNQAPARAKMEETLGNTRLARTVLNLHDTLELLARNQPGQEELTMELRKVLLAACEGHFPSLYASALKN